MLKKTITYTDYNGNERTEDFYFNLTKPELIKMEYEFEGGLSNKLKDIKDADHKTIIDLFEFIVTSSYGEKSSDGKHFVKNEKIREDFLQSEAYSVLFMELLTDSDKANSFISGVIPDVSSLKTKVDELPEPR